MTTQLIITAATGRMGKELLTAAFSDSETEISAAIARKNHPLIGTDIGYMVGANPQGIFLSSDLNSVLTQSSVLIDFSLPEYSIEILEMALATKTPIVIGTTGFTEEQKSIIESASQEVPIVFAANFSLGVNSLIGLVTQATKLLSNKADIEIFEAHHKYKVDAPSGTALAIGDAIAEVKGVPLSDIATEDRSGKRTKGSIGFSVMRAGDIIGTHETVFALNGEMLSIRHEAQSRSCFAQGALEAAKWLAEKPADLYSMQNVLFD